MMCIKGMFCFYYELELKMALCINQAGLSSRFITCQRYVGLLLMET